MKSADDILKKHEDENEMHFHECDRKFIIEAMNEYAQQFKSTTKFHIPQPIFIKGKLCKFNSLKPCYADRICNFNSRKDCK